jgi:nucleolar protein 15
LNKKEQPEEKKPKASDERGVVYLGHVPHGFYENEMKLYFSQFGEVTNINIPKSKVIQKSHANQIHFYQNIFIFLFSV